MTRCLRSFASLIVALALVAGMSSPATAQTTLTPTTLSAAIDSTTDSLIVASATDVVVGRYLVVEREAMLVRVVSGTNITVSRGQNGTVARAHGANAIVYAGVAAAFPITVEPVAGSACTSTEQAYLPRVSIPSGNIYTCTNSVWYQIGPDVGAIYVTCRALAVADQIDQSCFTADRDYVVVNITEVHAVAESVGTLTLIPRRQQSTEAPASGDALATAIDMVGAGAVAQTVKTATLTTTAADLLLDAGDRLGLDYTDDTAGELAGVLVTFTLVPR